MALLMEYIVVSIYIYIGLTIPLNRGGARLPTNAAVGNGDQEPGYAERDQALKQPTAFVGGE
jgi:hypothetical protein